MSADKNPSGADNGPAEIGKLKQLSEQSGFPGIDLNQICINLRDLEVLPRETAEQHLALPVLVKGERLFVALANPTEKRTINEIEFVTNKKVFPYIALPSTLQRVLSEAYDLHEQGKSHYVGSRCPPETLRKAGLQRRPPPPRRQRPTEPAPVVPAAELPRRGAPTMPASLAEGSLPEETLQPGSTEPRQYPSAVVVDDTLREAVELGRSAEGADFTDPLLQDQCVTLPPPPLEAAPPATAEQATVLVVDDEPDIRSMMVRLLATRGYRVLEAGNGEAALRLVRDREPSLIVLDAMLPKVHGFEIARRLKSSDRYRHIPIVMVSAVYRGWRFAQDIKANYRVESFIEKPFKMDELLAAVEAGLSGSTPRSASDASADSMSEEARRLMKAGIAAYKAGNIEEAVGHLREGVRIDPLAFRVRFQLGLLYGKAGQLYDAIQELETALSIRSDYFPALKNLAVLYQNAGFRNKAIEMWERCLTGAPDDATRETIKRHLVAVL